MASQPKTNSGGRPRKPPGTTPEARENQLISIAVDLAEKQILAGTASSQLITHYVKLGSSREKLEQMRIAHENKLLEAKREHMESEKRMEEVYSKALSAMRSYSGLEPEEDEDGYDE